MISEKQTENEILTYLLAKGVFVFKVQTTGIFDPGKGVFRAKRNANHIVGISDILGIYKGRFIAIEVKRPYVSAKTNLVKIRTQKDLEKKATLDQVNFINKINKEGGLGFYADSLDIVRQKLFNDFD